MTHTLSLVRNCVYASASHGPIVCADAIRKSSDRMPQCINLKIVKIDVGEPVRLHERVYHIADFTLYDRDEVKIDGKLFQIYLGLVDLFGIEYRFTYRATFTIPKWR